MKRFVAIIIGVFLCCVAYADTETINWYVDDSLYNTTTCQTGGDITLQTAPAKRGHTFTGWKVALYDFSTLNPSIRGTEYEADASGMTWSVSFSYGEISGTALCSSTEGAYAVAGAPDESMSGEAKYCWCKATAYTPKGSDIVYGPLSPSAWVRYYVAESSSACLSSCTGNCGFVVMQYIAFRQTLFGVTQ